MSPKKNLAMMECYLEDDGAVPGTGALSGAVVTGILITFVVAIWG